MTHPSIKKRVREIIRGGKVRRGRSWNQQEGHHRIFHASTLAKRIAEELHGVVRDCAKVAEDASPLKGTGYTATINGKIATAILRHFGLETR